jgi:uncharacterized membrane protein YraQ (UPF0718 family)
MLLDDFFMKMLAILSRVWAPLLAGLAINFLIELALPKKNVLKGFGKKDFFTIVKASVTGFILSSLSFGVIPAIIALKKNGASVPAIAAMLAFTPWSGAVGLLITISYVGFENTLILFGFSFLLSIIVGVMFSILEKIKWLVKTNENISQEYLKENNYKGFEKYVSKRRGIKEILISSTGLIKNVIIAMLVASFFQLFAPIEIFSQFSAEYSSIYAIPLATLIEIIGEGFSVFAGELYLLGANLGAIFAIISAGVITDINELSMLAKIFSKRSATLYLIISLSLVILFSSLMA